MADGSTTTTLMAMSEVKYGLLVEPPSSENDTAGGLDEGERKFLFKGIKKVKQQLRKPNWKNCMKRADSYAHTSVLNALRNKDLIARQTKFFKALDEKKQKGTSRSHCSYYVLNQHCS